jgi:hypothetical protein
MKAAPLLVLHVDKNTHCLRLDTFQVDSGPV